MSNPVDGSLEQVERAFEELQEEVKVSWLI